MMSVSHCIFILILLSLFTPSLEFGMYIWAREKNVTKHCVTPNCLPLSVNLYYNGEWTNSVTVDLTPEECLVKYDIADVLCPKVNFPSKCALYTSWGTKVTSCADLSQGENIFMVHEGRVFMIPTKGVGDRREVHHVSSPIPYSRIVLETLSETPRIFKLENFITEDEAQRLLINARDHSDDPNMVVLPHAQLSSEDRPVHTGNLYYDQFSEIALLLKRRAFDLLGIHPVDDSLVEGFQIIHYNTTGAYSSHLDWMEPTKENLFHDYHSQYDGTNRFVSMIFYLKTPTLGGDTVFPLLEPKSGNVRKKSRAQIQEEVNDYLTLNKVDRLFSNTDDTCHGNECSNKASHDSSWQRNLLDECHHRFHFQAKALDVLVFYSQKPTGLPDYLTKHAGCPVLKGEKWIANLWFWNGPRAGTWLPTQHPNPPTSKLATTTTTGSFSSTPLPSSGGLLSHILFTRPTIFTVSASFESRDVVAAKLYWEDTPWEELIPGKPIKVNTFASHQWNVYLDDEKIVTWVIQSEPFTQRFVLSSEDLPVYNFGMVN